MFSMALCVSSGAVTLWFRGHGEREYNSSVSLQSMPHFPFGEFASPCFPTVCIFLAGATDPLLAIGGLNVSCSIFSFTLFLRSLGFGSVFNCLPSSTFDSGSGRPPSHGNNFKLP